AQRTDLHHSGQHLGSGVDSSSSGLHSMAGFDRGLVPTESIPVSNQQELLFGLWPIFARLELFHANRIEARPGGQPSHTVTIFLPHTHETVSQYSKTLHRNQNWRRCFQHNLVVHPARSVAIATHHTGAFNPISAIRSS